MEFVNCDFETNVNMNEYVKYTGYEVKNTLQEYIFSPYSPRGPVIMCVQKEIPIIAMVMHTTRHRNG